MTTGIPIISIFKSSKEDIDATQLFSEYKKIQAIKKKKALEESRLGKVKTRLNDLEEELEEKIDIVSKILSEKAYIAAKDVLFFLKNNCEILRNGSTEDIEREFYRFVSKYSSTSMPPDGLLTFYAEIDETNHLIICPDKENCSIHKSHLGMGVVRVDIRDFQNE
jgi:hypothetical protein